MLKEFSDYAKRLLAGESFMTNFASVNDRRSAAQLRSNQAETAMNTAGDLTQKEIDSDAKTDSEIAELQRLIKIKLAAKLLQALLRAKVAEERRKAAEAQLLNALAELLDLDAIERGRQKIGNDKDSLAYLNDVNKLNQDLMKLLESRLRDTYGAGAQDKRNALNAAALKAAQEAQDKAELARVAAEKALLEGNVRAAQLLKLREDQLRQEAELARLKAALDATKAQLDAVAAARAEELMTAKNNAEAAARAYTDDKMKALESLAKSYEDKAAKAAAEGKANLARELKALADRLTTEALKRLDAAVASARAEELLIAQANAATAAEEAERSRAAAIADELSKAQKTLDETTKRLTDEKDSALFRLSQDHQTKLNEIEKERNRGLEGVGRWANEKYDLASNWVKNNPGKAAGYGAAGAAGLYGLYKLYKYLKNKKNKTPQEVQLMNDAKDQYLAQKKNFATKTAVDSNGRSYTYDDTPGAYTGKIDPRSPAGTALRSAKAGLLNTKVKAELVLGDIKSKAKAAKNSIPSTQEAKDAMIHKLGGVTKGELNSTTNRVAGYAAAGAHKSHEGGLEGVGKWIDDKYNQADKWTKDKLGLSAGATAGIGAAGAAGIYGLYRLIKKLSSKPNRTSEEDQKLAEAKEAYNAKRANFTLKNNITTEFSKGDDLIPESEFKNFGIWIPINILATVFHGMTTNKRRVNAILERYPTRLKLLSKMNSLRSSIKNKNKLDKFDRYVDELKSCKSDDELRPILEDMMRTRYGLLILSMIFNPVHSLVLIWKFMTADDADRQLSRLT